MAAFFLGDVAKGVRSASVAMAAATPTGAQLSNCWLVAVPESSRRRLRFLLCIACYELDAQDQAARYFGEAVTVEGTLQGNTLHVVYIKKLTSIGLQAGRTEAGFTAFRGS